MSEAADISTNDPIALRAMVMAEHAENERLRQIIRELQRHRFGRRAESLPEDQMLLALEEVEKVEAAETAATEKADPAARETQARTRRVNRGALPAHLPRVETIVDIEDKACPCCGGALHRIGESLPSGLTRGMSPNGSTSSQRSSACWQRGVRNTPAGPARKASSRPLRRRG